MWKIYGIFHWVFHTQFLVLETQREIVDIEWTKGTPLYIQSTDWWEFAILMFGMFQSVLTCHSALRLTHHCWVPGQLGRFSGFVKSISSGKYFIFDYVSLATWRHTTCSTDWSNWSDFCHQTFEISHLLHFLPWKLFFHLFFVVEMLSGAYIK